MNYLIAEKKKLNNRLLEKTILFIILLLVVANLVAAGVCIVQERHMNRQIRTVEAVQQEIKGQFDETGSQWEILKPWEERD